MRNRQISSNNTEIIFQENEGSEGEIRAFSGFVLASDAIEYPNKRLAFDIAWLKSNESEQKGWREAII